MITGIQSSDDIGIWLLVNSSNFPFLIPELKVLWTNVKQKLNESLGIPLGNQDQVLQQFGDIIPKYFQNTSGYKKLNGEDVYLSIAQPINNKLKQEIKEIVLDYQLRQTTMRPGEQDVSNFTLQRQAHFLIDLSDRLMQVMVQNEFIRLQGLMDENQVRRGASNNAQNLQVIQSLTLRGGDFMNQQQGRSYEMGLFQPTINQSQYTIPYYEGIQRHLGQNILHQDVFNLQLNLRRVQYFNFDLPVLDTEDIDEYIRINLPLVHNDSQNLQMNNTLDQLVQICEIQNLRSPEAQWDSTIERVLLLMSEAILSSSRWNLTVSSHSKMSLNQEINLKQLTNLNLPVSDDLDPFYLRDSLMQDLKAYFMESDRSQLQNNIILSDDQIQINNFEGTLQGAENVLQSLDFLKIVTNQVGNTDDLATQQKYSKNFSFDTIQVAKLASVINRVQYIKSDDGTRDFYTFTSGDNFRTGQKLINNLFQNSQAKKCSLPKLHKLMNCVKDIIQNFVYKRKSLPIIFFYLFGNTPIYSPSLQSKQQVQDDMILSQSKWLAARSYSALLFLIQDHQVQDRNLFNIHPGRDYSLYSGDRVILDNNLDIFQAEEQAAQGLRQYRQNQVGFNTVNQLQRQPNATFNDLGYIFLDDAETSLRTDQTKGTKLFINMDVVIDETFQSFQQAAYDLQIGPQIFQFKQEYHRDIAERIRENHQEVFSVYGQVYQDVMGEFMLNSPLFLLLQRVIFDMQEVFNKNLDYNQGYRRNPLNVTFIQFRVKIPMLRDEGLYFTYQTVRIRQPTDSLMLTQNSIEAQVTPKDDKVKQAVLSIVQELFREFLTIYFLNQEAYLDNDAPFLRDDQDILYMDARVEGIKFQHFFIQQKGQAKVSNDNKIDPKKIMEKHLVQMYNIQLPQEVIQVQEELEIPANRPDMIPPEIKQIQQKPIKQKEEKNPFVEVPRIFKKLKTVKEFVSRFQIVKLIKRLSNKIPVKQSETTIRAIIGTLLTQQPDPESQHYSQTQEFKNIKEVILGMWTANQFEQTSKKQALNLKAQKLLKDYQDFIAVNVQQEEEIMQKPPPTQDRKKQKLNPEQEESKIQIQKEDQYDEGGGVERYQIQTQQENSIELQDFKQYRLQFQNSVKCLTLVFCFLVQRYTTSQDVKQLQPEELILYLELKMPQLFNQAERGEFWNWLFSFVGQNEELNIQEISFRVWSAQNQAMYYEKYYQKDMQNQIIFVISDYHVLLGDEQALNGFIRKKFAGRQLIINRQFRQPHNKQKYLKFSKPSAYKTYQKSLMAPQDQNNATFNFPRDVSSYKESQAILAFDFETTSESQKQLQTFCVCLQGKVGDRKIEEAFEYPDCEYKLVFFLMDLSQELNQQASTRETKIDLVGWNNSRFDNYFLLQALFRIIGPCNVQIMGTLQDSKCISFDRYVVKDLCLTVQASLNKACIQYQIPQDQGKQNFNILDYPTMEDLQKHRDKIIAYCRQDCIAVLSVLSKFQSQIEALKKELADKFEMQEADRDKKLIGSAVPISVSSFSNKFLGFFKPLYDFNFQGVYEHGLQQKCRASYTGGLTQTFNLSLQKECFFFDISSLYPSIMAQDILPCSILGSKQIYLDEQEERAQKIKQTRLKKTNLYRVERYVYKPGRIPRIPQKINLTNIFLEQGCEEAQYMWGLELNYEDFEQLVISEEIEFQTLKEQTHFQATIKFLYQLKQQATQDNQKVLRNLTKLILNSLYGYFGKKDFDTKQYYAIPEWDLFLKTTLMQEEKIPFDTTKTKVGQARDIVANNYRSFVDQIDSFEIKEVGNHKYLGVSKKAQYDNQATGSCVYLASFITACARQRMIDLIKLGGGLQNFIYMDTDSLVMTRQAFQLLIQTGQIKNELGYLVNEISGKADDKPCLNFQAFAKKIYVAQDTQGRVIKSAFKGVQKDQVQKVLDKQTGNWSEEKSYSMLYFNQLRTLSREPIKQNISLRKCLQKKNGQIQSFHQNISLQLKSSMKVQADGSCVYFKNKEEYLQYYKKNLVYDFLQDNENYQHKTYNFMYI